MIVKVTVKGRFVHSGKVYGSPEELPENVRQAYEKAMAGCAGDSPGGAPGARVKIALNGTESGSLDALPPEERKVYESAMGAVETGHVQPGGRAGLAPGSGGDPEPAPLVTAAPIEPGSANSRSIPVALLVGLVVLMLLLGFYLDTSAGPR